jgi:hypothetical protein
MYLKTRGPIIADRWYEIANSCTGRQFTLMFEKDWPRDQWPKELYYLDLIGRADKEWRRKCKEEWLKEWERKCKSDRKGAHVATSKPKPSRKLDLTCLVPYLGLIVACIGLTLILLGKR